MFCKMIRTSGYAKIQDITFEIKELRGNLYSLVETRKGTKTVLIVGSRFACENAAKECVEMMFTVQ